MEELRLVVAHGVFEGAEDGQEVIEGEAPHEVAVGLGAGKVEAVGGAEVVGEEASNEGDDLVGDGVGREGGRGGDGDLTLVGVAVVGIEGELAADGLGVGHEYAGLLAHAAVKAVHDEGFARFVRAEGGEEVLRGGGPGGVGYEVELEALALGGGEVEAELALGGSHDCDGREVVLALQIEESLAVVGAGEVVEDGDAAGGLLEREVAHVADEDDELFLVVGAAVGLDGGLDEDDAGLGVGLLGEGAGAVGEAVVGDVDPATAGEVGG